MAFLNFLGPLGTVLGSGVQALGNIIGGNQQEKAQREVNEINYKMFQEQLGFTEDMWNKQNVYNTPAAQRKRYEEAGINPYLAMGNITGGNAESVTTPSPNAAVPAVGQGQGIAAAGAAIGQGLQQAVPVVQQVMSNREAIKALTIENAFKASQFQLELVNKQADIENKLAQRNLTDKQRELFQGQLDSINEQLVQLREYNRYVVRRAKAGTEKLENEADLAYYSARREREMSVYYNILSAYLPGLQSAQIRSLGAQVLQSLAQSDLLKSQKTTEDAIRNDKVRNAANNALETAERTLGIKLDNKQKDAIMPHIIKRAKKEADAKKFGPFEYYGEFDYSRDFEDTMQGTSRW